MRARAGHDGEGEQQPLRGDEAVASLLGGLLGLLEDAPELGREVDLARAGSLDARLLRKLGLDGGERPLRVGAGGAKQVGGEALAVVEQDLEEVLGREALVAAALREGLRGLEEAAGTFRVDLWIHGIEPFEWSPCGRRWIEGPVAAARRRYGGEARGPQARARVDTRRGARIMRAPRRKPPWNPASQASIAIR